jgi:hypothetical protein
VFAHDGSAPDQIRVISYRWLGKAASLLSNLRLLSPAMEEETYLQDANASCTKEEFEAMFHHSHCSGIYETGIDPGMSRSSNDDKDGL